MANERKTPVEHDPGRIEEALPWYVNGTLDEADRAWIEQMLSADESAAAASNARKQLAFDRSLADVLDQKVSEVPADIGWSRLIQRVKADAAPGIGGRERATGDQAGGAPRAAAGGSWLQRLARLVSPILSPQVGMAMAVLLAVQTIAIGVLMTEWQGSGQPDSVGYRSPGQQQPVNAIRALMNESITEKAMRDALSANGASIVEGPNPLGEYWIVTGARNPEAVARALRDAGVVASYVIDQRLRGR